MNKKLYNMMDWAAVEEVVYAECLHPEEYLGSHNVGRSSIIQCFFPGARAVDLVFSDKSTVKMDEMDEDGFFATLIPNKNVHNYSYNVWYKDSEKKSVNYHETYIGKYLLSEEELDLIDSGSDYEVYELLGAHERIVDGVKGVLFAVYAPYALRVSVVGDFNNFNNKMHQMSLHDNYGIFELFIPGVKKGDAYRFDMLVKGHRNYQKCDPFSFSNTKKDDGIYSIVSSSFDYKWKDSSFIRNRNKNVKNGIFNIYELCAQCFSNNDDIKSITDKVIKHVKEIGYTHVELMPIMESYNDSLGFRPSFLFSLDKNVGTFEDLSFFVNALHNENIGVILQISISSFDQNEFFMSSFDGSCIFEHEDVRKGVDPRTGGKMYQFGDAFVNQFLISAINFWVDNFHFDAVKIMDLSNILYLDYYRNEFEWIPNMYGSNENLEAISFIRKLNKFLHKSFNSFITIAEEQTGWPYLTVTDDMTEEERNECLLFDYCICNGFNSDVLPYLALDPIERASHHDELTLSMNYQYRENYILSVSHNDIDFGKGGLITQMFGDDRTKMANLKLFYAYLMSKPGKKSVFMGQDDAMYNSFDGNSCLYYENIDNNIIFQKYITDLFSLISSQKALYKYDYSEKGFKWINNFSAKENVLVFQRNADTDEETLVIVLNFANKIYEKYQIGVPFEGKYKEIFNSDDIKYNGNNNCNSRLIMSRIKECDGLENSILIKLAPLSFCVFGFVAFNAKELKERETKRREKEKLLAQKKKSQEELRKQKSKIRASLKEELDRKIREAEEAIFNGSEYKK